MSAFKPQLSSVTGSVPFRFCTVVSVPFGLSADTFAQWSLYHSASVPIHLHSGLCTTRPQCRYLCTVVSVPHGLSVEAGRLASTLAYCGICHLAIARSLASGATPCSRRGASLYAIQVALVHAGREQLIGISSHLYCGVCSTVAFTKALRHFRSLCLLRLNGPVGAQCPLFRCGFLQGIAPRSAPMASRMDDLAQRGWIPAG